MICNFESVTHFVLETKFDNLSINFEITKRKHVINSLITIIIIVCKANLCNIIMIHTTFR